MATYYKGTLYLNSELNDNILLIGNIAYGNFSCNADCKSYYCRLKRREQKCLESYCFSLSSGDNFTKVNNKDIISILETMLSDCIIIDKDNSKLEIIFEEFTDVNGIIYGKELHTGLIFPLAKNVVLFPNFSESQYRISKKNSFGYDIFLQIILMYHLPTLSLCETLIRHVSVADQNEVLEYQNRFNRGFGSKRRKRQFEATVRKWFNKNVYSREVVPRIEEPKKEESRIEQSSETKVMDNIEYLLIQLKKININLYLKYQKEYEELLNGLNQNSELRVIPPTLLAFYSLEASIEVDLFSVKNNADNILEYLSNLQKEYLINTLIGSERKTSITFNELEKINELFLKAKNRYGLLEQRSVLKKIAFLYLMELIENIDNIDTFDLENSYFVDSLRTILMHIEILRELGIIKSNVLIDLNQDLSVQNILEIIKTIEFNKFSNEESLELIKKL